MKELKILHTADLHLDSAFEGLSAGKAALRRGEQRELLRKLAALVQEEQVQLVLMAGDLLDSDNSYYETGEELIRCMTSIGVPVFIAPGNHDYYSARSLWPRIKLPANAHLFTENTIRGLEFPTLGVRVYGAAFTDKRSGPVLRGFSAARKDGYKNILVLHGEVGAGEDSPYDPITEAEIASSGMDYVALGHVHKASGLRRAGDVWYSWPGCPEGRGFDETGDKTVSLITLAEDGSCTLETRSIALRHYEHLTVDITNSDPLLVIHTLLPDESVRDIYRITLVGETDDSPDLNRLRLNLSELFFELQLRDETTLRTPLWEHACDDTLRGLFLKKLKKKYDEAADDTERHNIELAARWGLAAMDNREEAVRYEDS